MTAENTTNRESVSVKMDEDISQEGFSDDKNNSVEENGDGTNQYNYKDAHKTKKNPSGPMKSGSIED